MAFSAFLIYCCWPQRRNTPKQFVSHASSCFIDSDRRRDDLYDDDRNADVSYNNLVIELSRLLSFSWRSMLLILSQIL